MIRLKDIPVMWLTCSKTVNERRGKMLDSLQQIGVTNPEQIDCPITQPYHVGLAQGHVKALLRHSPPFLILEDDARLIPENHLNEFPVPFETEALYLGTTTFGRWKRSTAQGSVIAAEEDPDHLRIYNMLSLHAVVYFSRHYVRHVIDLMLRYQRNPVGGCDDLIADTMHNHRVLCRRKPVFFQDDGRANRCTTEPIEPAFLSL